MKTDTSFKKNIRSICMVHTLVRTIGLRNRRANKIENDFLLLGLVVFIFFVSKNDFERSNVRSLSISGALHYFDGRYVMQALAIHFQ